MSATPSGPVETLVAEFNPSEGIIVRVYSDGAGLVDHGDIRYALADCIAMHAQITAQF